jgi:hypothetical protein
MAFVTCFCPDHSIVARLSPLYNEMFSGQWWYYTSVLGGALGYECYIHVYLIVY